MRPANPQAARRTGRLGAPLTVQTPRAGPSKRGSLCREIGLRGLRLVRFRARALFCPVATFAAWFACRCRVSCTSAVAASLQRLQGSRREATTAGSTRGLTPTREPLRGRRDRGSVPRFRPVDVLGSAPSPPGRVLRPGGLGRGFDPKGKFPRLDQPPSKALPPAQTFVCNLPEPNRANFWLVERGASLPKASVRSIPLEGALPRQKILGQSGTRAPCSRPCPCYPEEPPPSVGYPGGPARADDVATAGPARS